MAIQHMAEKLKAALYEEAQTNGLNATEYRILLGDVDRLIDAKVLTSVETVHGHKPNLDYNINGKENF